MFVEPILIILKCLTRTWVDISLLFPDEKKKKKKPNPNNP